MGPPEQDVNGLTGEFPYQLADPGGTSGHFPGSWMACGQFEDMWNLQKDSANAFPHR